MFGDITPWELHQNSHTASNHSPMWVDGRSLCATNVIESMFDKQRWDMAPEAEAH
jgi:hypothetical protein